MFHQPMQCVALGFDPADSEQHLQRVVESGCASPRREFNGRAFTVITGIVRDCDATM